MRQSRNKTALTAMGVAVVSTLLLCVCASSALILAPLNALAAGASAAGGGGNGACTALPASGTGANLGGCSVVAWAQLIASHLQMCGADPTIGAPNFDTCYTLPPAPDAMPQVVLDYLAAHYPGDRAAWVSGNFQYVSLVVAAYDWPASPCPKPAMRSPSGPYIARSPAGRRFLPATRHNPAHPASPLDCHSRVI